jgi:hypothetical protein
MATKTLGQIAYEATKLELITHQLWSDMDETDRGIWEDAAEAVRDELQTDPRWKSVSVAIGQWRTNDLINKVVPLHVWLGMTEVECRAFLERGELPLRR